MNCYKTLKSSSVKDLWIKRFKLALHLGSNLPKINPGGEGGRERGRITLKSWVWFSALFFFFLFGIGSQANILWRQKHYKMIWLEAEWKGKQYIGCNSFKSEFQARLTMETQFKLWAMGSSVWIKMTSWMYFIAMDLRSWWSSGKDLKWAGEDKKILFSDVSWVSAPLLADPV